MTMYEYDDRDYDYRSPERILSCGHYGATLRETHRGEERLCDGCVNGTKPERSEPDWQHLDTFGIQPFTDGPPELRREAEHARYVLLERFLDELEPFDDGFERGQAAARAIRRMRRPQWWIAKAHSGDPAIEIIDSLG